MKFIYQRKVLFTLLFVTALSLILSSCKTQESSAAENPATVSIESMPVEIQSAPVTVQEAYRFAVANPEVLGQIPCYCGCGAMGHTSNYACYVSEVETDGSVQYDTHALGCSICVDITQDTMRLLDDGMSVQDIKTYIDQTYSLYGPTNIP